MIGLRGVGEGWLLRGMRIDFGHGLFIVLRLNGTGVGLCLAGCLFLVVCINTCTCCTYSINCI